MPRITKASALYQVTQKNGERWAPRGPMFIRIWQPRANLARRDRRAGDPHSVRGTRAVGSNTGRATDRQIRARREVIIASGAFQTPQLLMLFRNRRSRRAGKARHCDHASLARRRANLQDHPDFIFAYMSTVRISPACRSVASCHQLSRHHAVPARTPRTDDVNFGRMRRISQNPAPISMSRHPVAFRHDHRRRPRPQTPLGPRLFLHVCLLRPKAA